MTSRASRSPNWETASKIDRRSSERSLKLISSKLISIFTPSPSFSIPYRFVRRFFKRFFLSLLVDLVRASLFGKVLEPGIDRRKLPRYVTQQCQLVFLSLHIGERFLKEKSRPSSLFARTFDERRDSSLSRLTPRKRTNDRASLVSLVTESSSAYLSRLEVFFLLHFRQSAVVISVTKHRLVSR